MQAIWIASLTLAMTRKSHCSRDATAPELCNDHAIRRIVAAPRGRRSAERRMPTIAAQHQQTSPLVDVRRAARHQTSVRVCATYCFGARSPSGASTAALAGTPIPAQLQAMLPGTWTARDPEKVDTGFPKDQRAAKASQRALPALSCPSPVTAPHASAVVPKGMMPKAAPERVASPRGGTALAPLPKVPSRRRPSMSEMIWRT